MRQIIISNTTRRMLAGHILSRSVSISHQLADKSWEALVDDDMGFAIDCLCGDPDRAIQSIVTAKWVTCPRCDHFGPLLDDDCCEQCKLVL